MNVKRYLVTWTIDMDADSPEEAAACAFRIQRDASSIATCFDVTDSETGQIKAVDVQEVSGPHHNTDEG
jgi:hypothetical protein